MIFKDLWAIPQASRFPVLLGLWYALSAPAAVLYVDVNGTNPIAPFANWSNAAVTIQAAVDVAQAEDEIHVTNGVYRSGGRAVFGTMTNRVAVTKPLRLLSVNGPEATIIEGYRLPSTTNGNGAVRCVYLTNGALLAGFTLTNGATRGAPGGDDAKERSGGGVWCESDSAIVSNCVLIGNAAFNAGGGACSGSLKHCWLFNNVADQGGGLRYGTATDCLFATNSAYSSGGGASLATLEDCLLRGNAVNKVNSWPVMGGGAYGGNLTHCTLVENRAEFGGGAFFSGALIDCVLSNNTAVYGGGGAGYEGVTNTISHCLFTANSAADGGGVYQGTLSQCIVSNNSAARGGGAFGGMLRSVLVAGNIATNEGGGTHSCDVDASTIRNNHSAQGGGVFAAAYKTVSNCALYDNSADYGGGTAGYYSTFKNCTLAGNSASIFGGGAYEPALVNSIICSNSAPLDADVRDCTLYYCCAPQGIETGPGNFTNAPRFMDFAARDLRLQSISPCINSARAQYGWVSGDMDADGNPRVSGDAADVGAYEFQNPASRISYLWLQRYGFPNDGSSDFDDADHDGLNNWQEWKAGTSPVDSASVLRMLEVAKTESGWSITWQSAPDVIYYLQRGDPGAPFAFSTIQSNLPSGGDTSTATDSETTASGSCFYRVGVQ